MRQRGASIAAGLLVLSLALAPAPGALAQKASANCTARLAALGECTKGSSALRPGKSRAERELAKRAQAMQRTIAEGLLTGAAIGTAVDIARGRRNNKGLSIGITLGAAAGSYVALLQQKYARKEQQLERVRDDIRRANAELEAAIATMRAVLDLQTRELAALKRRAGSNARLAGELREAEANLANMRAAVNGAEGWKREFESTRSLKLVRGQLTGVDKELAELSARIQRMRRIADTLNGAIKS